MKRKRKIKLCSILLAVVMISSQISWLSEVSADAGDEPIKKKVTLTEGTNISVTVSPDHKNIIMDLQGTLWTLPLSGGEGTRITDNFDDPAFPEWSPDGKRIVYQSYKDGNYHIWSMKPNGEDKQKLTSGYFDYREPTYSPDSSKIAFSSDKGGNYDIWVLDIETEELSQWTDSSDEKSEPTWSPDGEEIAYINGTNIEATDSSGNKRILIESKEKISSPSWSPDGEKIAYNSEGNLMISGEQITEDEDIFPFPVVWLSDKEIIYTADGKIKKRNIEEDMVEDIPFSVEIEVVENDYGYKDHDFDSEETNQVKGIVSPELSPDAKNVVFVALNDLWLWDIEGGEPRPLTDDPYLEMAPEWSPDGKKIAYSTDKGGTEDIYIIDLESGNETQLTDIPDKSIRNAAWSPDGSQIAFQDHTGVTSTVNIETGEITEVIEELTYPGKPAWGPGGNTLALTAIKTFSDRFREGLNQVLTVNLETGEQNYSAPIPEESFKSLSNRETSGPVWSPDGKHMAYIVESQLYVIPVDENGEATGDPRLITEDIAESPSWSGDSNSLLYLSNGELKLASIDEGKTITLPFKMEWKPHQPTGKTVIHAGAVWDGVSEEIEENVDIIIEGNRIKDVKPHDKSNADKADYIDASSYTVMPGLWDTHIHQEMTLYTSGIGSRTGRQLLSFGITSTISMGDIAYRSTEESESLQSGATLGPRFFKTGELIEGSRVFYNVMRPTTNMDALEREIERAKAFDYDLIKTYVRLPNDFQAYVINIAHNMGIPTFSHYFYPSMAFGQDGTSHISATQRGFSRTVSQNGYAYEDVIKLSAASGMSMTSTLFDSGSLISYYPELFSSEDPRLKTLFTSWQYNNLEDKFDNSSKEYSDKLAKDVTILKDIIDAGGVVLAGTDTPIDEVAVPLHLNLKAMEEYGITNYDALRTATYYPAKQMGVLDDLGTIESGKLADLIFVEGNPLKDITDTTNVRMVMKNGEAYTMEEIIKPFDSQKENK